MIGMKVFFRHADSSCGRTRTFWVRHRRLMSEPSTAKSGRVCRAVQYATQERLMASFRLGLMFEVSVLWLRTRGLMCQKRAQTEFRSLACLELVSGSAHAP